ncbi:GNAT family N-acetyltransferase [Fredinandcohnia humi]
MHISSIKDLPSEKITDFLIKHWGSPKMVISSGVYDCSKLEGFIVLNEENNIAGLITYVIKDNECEIISLDSVEEGKGIGTALLKAVEDVAKENNCKVLKLITTNDNLLALRFYQKRGYYFSKLLLNAVEKARRVKPEIPLIGNDGIPIRDEILLEKLVR